jgi:aminomethyltransferase
MTLSNNPYEINLGWTVDLEQKADFIGKEALARINAEGISQRLLGGVIDGERMTRFNENFWPVYVSDQPAGHLTVCVYSPRLKQNLAFIMIKAEFASAGQRVEIRSPDGSMNATLCELPFISERQQ